MAQNRYLPYGYKIENGSTVIEQTEAEVIRRIYMDYASGLSYKKIAEQLTASDVRYMPDKPSWNKNMVARMLQNDSYLGTGKYPQIVTQALMQSAQKMAKPYNHTESDDIKLLKPLLVCGICGEPIKRRLKTCGAERWYCPSDTSHISIAVTDHTLLADIEKLQSHLTQNPQLAEQKRQSDNKADIEILRLQNEIEQAIYSGELDIEKLQRCITDLASKRYALIDDNSIYETTLVQKIGTLPKHKRDSNALTAIIAEVIVKGTTADALVLKNGQTIRLTQAEKGETPNG